MTNSTSSPAPKFDVFSASGVKLYSGVSRDDSVNGFSWLDGFGFITDSQIAADGLVLKPQG